MKKLYSFLTLIIVTALVFTGCGKETILSQEAAEREIIAFYETYIEADAFNYLLYRTAEEIKTNGVPNYILDRWGVESEVAYLANIEDGSFSLEPYASEDEIEEIMPELTYGTQISVYNTDDIQQLMDVMWGAGNMDIRNWSLGASSTFTSKGYLIVLLQPTGFMTDSWFEVGDVTFDGNYATLTVRGVHYYEYEQVLQDLSERSYQSYAEDDNYTLTYRIIARQLNLQFDDPGVNHTLDEILAFTEIPKEELGTINLVFRITEDGVYLVSCGPVVDLSTPVVPESSASA